MNFVPSASWPEPTVQQLSRGIGTIPNGFNKNDISHTLCSAQPTLLGLGPSCTQGRLDALWLLLQLDKWGTQYSVPKTRCLV